jgi:hypothetical protein
LPLYNMGCMVPRKKKNGTPLTLQEVWRETFAAILEGADISDKELAAVLVPAPDPKRRESQRSMLGRFRRGERNPSLAIARRINHAVALLTDHRFVEGVLNFAYDASSRSQDEQFGETLARDARRLLRWYGGYFKPGALECIDTQIRTLGAKKQRALVLRLSRSLRNTAIGELLPPASAPSFRDVCDALAESGIHVERDLSERAVAQLAYEGAQQTVLHELYRLREEAPGHSRLAARGRILAALSHPDVLAAIEVKVEGG